MSKNRRATAGKEVLSGTGIGVDLGREEGIWQSIKL